MTKTSANAQEASIPFPLNPLTRQFISPLDIPELLQLVFTFIDDYSLRTAVLVCRKWFLLYQHRLCREVTWDLKWLSSRPRHALERLPGAERLVVVCQNDHSWRGPDVHAALLSLQPPLALWSALAPLLRFKKAPFEELLHRPLREMVLKTGFNFKDKWLDRLPFPSSLTSLTIDKSQVMSLDLARILVLCPLLLSLHVSSAVFVYLAGLHTDRGLLALPGRLPLRTLVLKHLLTTQQKMEDLLTIMPDLEELRLISISKTSGYRWDWPEFRTHLQSLSLPLKKFHYSTQLIRSISDVQEEEILQVCPNAKERYILLYNLTPRIVTLLAEQPVVLTTLEIMMTDQPICQVNGWLLDFLNIRSGYSAYPLHRFLCEGSTLRHLKTLKIPYMVDFMDLHRRRKTVCTIGEDDAAQAISLLNVPGIWTCRGLETLHIELHFHELGAAANVHYDYMRIICGYISRVCPMLQDLFINLSGFCQTFLPVTALTWHPMELQGGLCLISKLKRLERLQLYMPQFGCVKKDITWLCPSGRTAEERAKRWSIAEGWTQQLGEAAILEERRLNNRTGAHSIILGEGAEDVELMDSMKNLGLLQDVKDMLQEMNKEDFVCLPDLRLFGCCGQLEQSPERVFRSVLAHEPPAESRSWFSGWSPF
ncbi:MAG: hypothetical protein JOS17DRAFT_756413 [Linnemannia elongata]|nr:MAG: hypothetical protein JOS17DRAFT_756413 [Linnemannia elongata]